MGFTLLERRGARYYYRQRVPKDLQPHFGRVELRRSLDTADPREARQRVKLEAKRAAETFEMMRGDAMTNDQLQKIADDYLRDTLRGLEVRRARGEGVPAGPGELRYRLQEQENKAVMLKAALTYGGLGEVARETADYLVSQHGLEVDPDSPEFLQLAREFAKRKLEVIRVEKERMQGNYLNGFDDLPQVLPQVAPLEIKSEPSLLLSQVIEAYVQDHLTLKKWTEKTEQENRSILAVFLELIGDRDITSIGHQDWLKVRTELVKLPSNPKKGKDREGRSLRELIAMKLSPMSQSTVNKYMIRLASFYKWAHRHEYVNKNVAIGLTLGKPKGKASALRDTYETADIERMFNALRYDIEKPEHFWIPLVGLYSGMRLDEVCQLHLADLKVLEGVPCFHVNEEGDKKVKTVAGVRVVPVHPALIELGFSEYVQALQAKGAVQLWPNCKKKRDGYSQDFGKWFQRFNKREIRRTEADNKKVFHSFRHGLVDCLKQTGIEEALAMEIVGHEQKNVTYGRYGKSLKPSVLLEILRKVDFGVDLEILKAKVPKELEPKGYR